MADVEMIGPQSTGQLAEQFDDLAQQREAGTLGMWVFLAGELLLFGGLFTGYAVYRWAYYEAFHEASGHLYMTLGSINTAVLLASSLLVALAVHAAESDRCRAIAGYLVAAVALGALFLAIKALEYYLDYREHLIPWVNFHFEESHAKNARLFFVFYFVMTGIHALHMLVGLGVLALLAVLAWRGHYSSEYHHPVEIAGLYWHFVDIVWVFLFPALYLLNPY